MTLPPRRRNLMLDTLATMGEEWNDTTSAMISVTVALVLLRLDMTTVTVSLDEILPTINQYRIDRQFFEKEGQPFMSITVTRKDDVVSSGDAKTGEDAALPGANSPSGGVGSGTGE